MRMVGLTLVLLALSACSTFNGVFKSGEGEDYNKLIYGDQNSNWTSGRLPVETPIDSSAKESEDRAPASYSETGSSGELMDPTDESVRSRVETGRGAYVSHYVRGDRATRDDFIDRASGDGSLWSGESDSNYFYSKNKVRAVGDIISVKVEDELLKTIGEEIKKSLNPAEQEVELALYLKNNSLAKDDKDLQAYRNVASEDLKSNEAENVKTRMEKAVRWSQVDLSKAIALQSNEDIRAEVIDRFPNGNYKIRAVKRVMYRGTSKLVSMVAVAPSPDFDENDLIKSGKLYEYKVRVAR